MKSCIGEFLFFIESPQCSGTKMDQFQSIHVLRFSQKIEHSGIGEDFGVFVFDSHIDGILQFSQMAIKSPRILSYHIQQECPQFLVGRNWDQTHLAGDHVIPRWG